MVFVKSFMFVVLVVIVIVKLVVFDFIFDNFDKVVYEFGKFIFVEFFVLWCGYCKKFVFVWEEFVIFLESQKDKIQIVKIDVDVECFFGK